MRGALHTLAGAPPLRDLTEQGRATAELVLAEVLNNIVEHAFALGPGPIEVRFDPCAGGIACHITDRGRAMPADRAPDGHFPAGLDGPPSTLPEGGFGWFLIRSLTHDLRYDRTGGLNHLRFTLPIC